MNSILFILYVSNQEISKSFYQKVLLLDPVLDVPGMTEFELASNCKLGLMPENSIAKILQQKTPHPSKGNGIPRCELYLRVKNARVYMERAIDFGGKAISALKDRDWGETVGYVADADGHVIAFSEER